MTENDRNREVASSITGRLVGRDIMREEDSKTFTRRIKESRTIYGEETRMIDSHDVIWNTKRIYYCV